MGIFKKIQEFISFSGDKDEFGYKIAARCNRCGEIIETRIDLRNDLSVYYGDELELKVVGNQPHFYCRKTLIGKERCFRRIELELTFDQNRKILDRQIVGGEFVSESDAAES